MKIRILAVIVSGVAFAWLGVSFAVSTELPHSDGASASHELREPVDPGHPDSHRLGRKIHGVVELPAWSEASQATGVILIGP